MSGTVQERIRRTLVEVATRLHHHGIPFLLGGSGLLAALGLVDEVRDLDLQVPGRRYDDLCSAARGWPRETTAEGTSLWATAWVVRLEVGGVTVDVLGDLSVREGGRIVRLPFRAGGLWQVDGIDVPLADPAVWWFVYRRYKPSRAELLESAIPLAARLRVVRELAQ